MPASADINVRNVGRNLMREVWHAHAIGPASGGQDL